MPVVEPHMLSFVWKRVVKGPSRSFEFICVWSEFYFVFVAADGWSVGPAWLKLVESTQKAQKTRCFFLPLSDFFHAGEEKIELL